MELSRRVGSRTAISLLVLVLGAGALAVAAFADLGASRRHTIRDGGRFRITVVADNGMNIDPALPSAQLQSVVEATCARLLSYPDKPPPQGYTLTPEVAKGYPDISNGGKTFTFVLRRDFRFSNGAPVRADAFERQIIRVLQSPEGFARDSLIPDIVGADRVQNGHVEGVEAHGYRLVITLRSAVPDFPARLTAPWFCAVPPNLQVDPEGVLTFPMAGPYYVTPESVRGRRIVLRRNPYYRGSRPHHVSEFVVDGSATDFGDVLDRVLQGKADWGWAPADIYFDTRRRSVV